MVKNDTLGHGEVRRGGQVLRGVRTGRRGREVLEGIDEAYELLAEIKG